MTVSGIRRYPEIPTNAGGGNCPLTFQQERVLYFCELEPDSSIWDINTCKRLTGRIDVPMLRRAVETLAGAYDVLRTKITRGSGGPVQSFDQDLGDAFRHIDLSGEAGRDPDDVLSAQLTAICQEPISRWTYDDLLFEVVLITLGPRDHALMFRVHHIIADAASVLILWRDLTAIYNGSVRGVAGGPVPEAVKYSDYARWQRRHFGEDQTREQEAYWLAQFQGKPPALDLPADAAPSSALSFKGGLAIVDIPRHLIDEFQMHSLDNRVLLFSSLFATYLVLLQKICQQEDITVGVLFSGRHYCRDLNDTVGFFVNMTAIRVNVGWDDRFDRLVQAVQGKVEEAYFMQDYPFERLIQKLAPSRGDGRVPLVRTMFNIVPDPEDEELPEGVEQGRWIDVATQTNAVQVDLIFDIHWGTKGAEIRIEHNTDIFHTGTVTRLANHYITLLRQLSSGWNVDLSRLALVDEDETRQLIDGWNPAPSAFDSDSCVHELFERQARQRPGDVAIVDGGETITFGEAERRANRLARLLRTNGVRPDGIVAIIGRRSAEMVLGQLGILKAGGAYLPINRDSPRRLIRDILNDAAPQAVIVPDDYRGEFDLQVPVLRLGESDVADLEDTPVAGETAPSNLAYVIYTSGSTGLPKGVMIEHRSVVNHVTNVDFLEFHQDDRVLQTGAPGFDATIFEIWGALLNGLRLYQADDDVLLDARALGDFLARHRITILFLTPSLLNLLADADPTIFRPLRHLITGGDVASIRHIERIRAANPGLRVINAYGPTENTAYSTCHPITRTERRSIPIGRPVPNSKAYIFDRDMMLSPVGAIGELYVGGVGLARGYLNRPALNDERFVVNPFVAGERLYRTGDLVRRRADGLIEFVGRADRQVKIRGFRIELGEIENRLLEHGRIREACVTAATGEDGSKFLCAYYVTEAEVGASELREYLSARLPAYMLPAAYCPLDRMPVTENGKIDQQALPVPQPGAGTDDRGARPRTDSETAIARIWEALLGTANIGVHDNFFEIGGHSLKASALAAQLSAAFGIPVSLRAVFDAPTVAELARFIASRSAKEACHGVAG